MRRLVFLFLAVLVFFPGPAAAARFSGAYLLELCAVDENGKERTEGGHTACQAYIAGVIDYHKVLRSMDIAPSVEMCVPETATSAELHAHVLKYLLKNVQHDSFVAAPAVIMALSAAYPCRR